MVQYQHLPIYKQDLRHPAADNDPHQRFSERVQKKWVSII
jgi:hypothetical protein